MTLEEYFRFEYGSEPTPKIDFTLRIALTDKGVEFYIHPSGRDGTTTPMLLVNGDTVTEKKWS